MSNLEFQSRISYPAKLSVKCECRIDISFLSETYTLSQGVTGGWASPNNERGNTGYRKQKIWQERGKWSPQEGGRGGPGRLLCTRPMG